MRYRVSPFSFVIFMLLINLSLAHAGKIGYDENTEIAVQGIVQRQSSRPYKGFSNFFLKTDWKIFRILTAPSWYLRKGPFRIRNGQTIKVIGSKFYGPDGSLCILAKSIQVCSNGRVIRFRDSLSRPVWSKGYLQKNSCMKIFFKK